MAKKCIPGLFCIENMTMFVLLFVILISFYCMISFHGNNDDSSSSVINNIMSVTTPTSKRDLFLDPYRPPLYTDGRYLGLSTRREVDAFPFPRHVSSYALEYQQMGILTKMPDADKVVDENQEEIMPLMGRRLNNREKWQYYTISNNRLQSKLPVKSHGKSCTGEYGCDEIYNNDTVHVESLGKSFKATIYENGTFY